MFRTDLLDDIFSISPTGTTGLFFQNGGDTRRQGLEVSGAATLGARWDLRLTIPTPSPPSSTRSSWPRRG